MSKSYEYNKGYAKDYLKNLDEMKVRAEKGTRDRWKEEAAKRDKSLNQFIIDSVEAEIEKQ